MSKMLRLLPRIVIALAIVVAIAVAVTQWILPVTLSIQTARKPPVSAWLTPRQLTDHSVSPASGTKISYCGYDFEVPWTDLDDTNINCNRGGMAVLKFRSGLKLIVGASPAKLWLTSLFPSIPMSAIERTYNVHSDYDLLDAVYTFTPDKMHLLALSPGIHYRESLMLSLKSAALLPAAETGFFYVSNSTHKGFQQGDPQSWPLGYYPKSRAAVNLQLFSDQGSLDINLGQKGFSDPLGVSQADVNRIIQTVHKAPEKIARASSSSQ